MNKWEDKDYIDYVIKGWTESKDSSHRNDLYDIIRRNHKNGMTLLDAGCGVGFDYPAISKIVCKENYTGIDISKNMVETAKKRNPKGSFNVGDVTNINFPDESFDIVVCSSVIRHLEEYGMIMTAMNELIRVAKKVVIIVHVLTEENTHLNHERPIGKGIVYNDWIINENEFASMIKSFGCKCNMNWTSSRTNMPSKKAIIEVFK